MKNAVPCSCFKGNHTESTMGGQPGKPKPTGNPPKRPEPQHPAPISEPPKPIPSPPIDPPPAPIAAHRGNGRRERNGRTGSGHADGVATPLARAKDHQTAKRAAAVTEHAPPANELEKRLRQQALLAEIGRRALADSNLDSLFTEAARLCALGLEVRYCKV